VKQFPNRLKKIYKMGHAASLPLENKKESG